MGMIGQRFTHYEERRTTAAAAIQILQSHNRVFMTGNCSVPQQLRSALIERTKSLQDVELVQVFTVGNCDCVLPEMQGHLRINSMFISEDVREAVNDGRADFTPVFLSEIPALFRTQLPIDVALIHVSPPDEHGFCSFGIEVGVTKAAADVARVVIAEVNPQMPRTLGDSFIHVSKINHIVEVDYPLPQAPQGGSSERHLKIGEYIAEMIPNGATLQMGIGSIPDAVLHNLANHRDLGVHTELFSDGVIDLVEAGVITCQRKTFHPGKIIAGFLFGSQRLYDFVHNNPLIELHPVDYVNDPFNIARNERMVAINSALQIDLTGQVNADSIGHLLYSGAG